MRVRPPLFLLAGVLTLASCSPSGDPEPEVSAGEPAGPDVVDVQTPAVAASVDRNRTSALRVQVTAAESGEPLANVAVIALRDRGSSGAFALARALEDAPRTDASGAAALNLMSGAYRIHLDPPAATPERIELAPGEEREMTLQLATSADLDVEVRVVGEADDSPIAGATVRALDVPSVVSGASIEATTDANGTAALRIPSWMPIIASVTADGFGETRVALRTVDGADSVRARLSLAAELSARVVDPAGSPVEGVEVVARVTAAELFAGDAMLQPNAARERAVVQRATSRADGVVELSLPANVGVVLEAEADEAAGRPQRTLEVVRLAPGESATRRLVLRTGTRIAGQLLGPGDEPVSGVAIWLVRGGGRRVFTRFEEVYDRVVTDDEGRFAFLGVEPGAWRVGPAPQRSPGTVIAAVPSLVDVIPGLQRAEVELRPPASLYLRGRAVDADGVALAGIGLLANNESQTASGISEPDGSFQLGPFLAGALKLRATAGPGFAAGTPHTVHAGDEDIELIVFKTGAIRGAVTRADGGVPSSAEVRLSRNDRGRGAGARAVHADGGGEYYVPDAEPGSYVVVARAEPGLVAAGKVDVLSEGTAQLDLDLGLGARARLLFDERHAGLVYIVYANALPVERGRVDSRRELVTQEFPAGEVSVELHDPRGMVDRRVDGVQAGRTVNMTFLN